MMVLCFAPILLIVALNIFYPQFAYLSFLALLACPLSIGLMMIFGDCKSKSGVKVKSKLH
jgi:hypothetical protein